MIDRAGVKLEHRILTGRLTNAKSKKPNTIANGSAIKGH